MKTFINKIIAEVWAWWHGQKAYKIWCREMEKTPDEAREWPLADFPTQALYIYLKRMDGTTTSTGLYIPISDSLAFSIASSLVR